MGVNHFIALKGPNILARSNASGIKNIHIGCPERALQLLSPFRAALWPIGCLQALPGASFVIAFQAIFNDFGFMPASHINLLNASVGIRESVNP